MKSFALKTLLPVAAALAVAVGFILFGSKTPGPALQAFFFAPFTNSYYLGNLLDQAGLVLLTALGFLLAHRISLFNLGGEGQTYAAALLAALWAGRFSWLPPPLSVLTGTAIAVIVCFGLGFFSGLLKEYLGINEVISSFLLSGALLPLCDYYIAGPLRDSGGNLLSTPPVPPAYAVPGLLPPSTLSWLSLLSPLIAVLLFYLLRNSRWGYETKILAANPELARSQGIKVRAYSLVFLGLSAAFHGLAGAFSVYGSHHAAFVGISSGLGWNGIAAAFLGRMNPLGTIFGAFFIAFLNLGTKAATLKTDFAFDLANLIQGAIFMLVSLSFLRRRSSNAR